MSLLGNLVSQVARSAMDPEDAQRNPVNQSSNSSTYMVVSVTYWVTY